MADIELKVYDQGCGSGATLLGSDAAGYDTKKMVRLGTTAGNKSICVQLIGKHLPSARRVQLFTYYSVDTVMR